MNKTRISFKFVQILQFSFLIIYLLFSIFSKSCRLKKVRIIENSATYIYDTANFRACLHLITDDNPVIREEFELINSLQILNEFNITVLPLQVRSSQDRLKLIENCLENREDAYKRQQRLLTLANYLRIEGNNKRIREGKVLQLIAEKSYQVNVFYAFIDCFYGEVQFMGLYVNFLFTQIRRCPNIQLGDFGVCATTCQQLIDANYHPAWRIIQKLGFCGDFQDLEFRQKTLRFSMCYGPNDVLERTLGQMHLLEIQILNKTLERWMMEHEMEDFEDVAGDSDDEFTDAMTTVNRKFRNKVRPYCELTFLIKNHSNCS